MVRTLLAKKCTVMVVPHERTKPITFSMPSLVLYLAVGALVSVIVTSLYLVAKRIDYASTVVHNMVLENKLEHFSKALITQRNAVAELKEVDGELRTLLGLKNKKAIIEAKGVGGPSDVDVMNANTLQNPNYIFSIPEFDATMITLQHEMHDVRVRAKKLFAHIKHERKMYIAMPKMWPTIGRISSRYGYRINPLTGRGEFHRGIDISNSKGTKILATADGKVVYAGWFCGYGKMILIQHGYGYTTRYGHCSKIVTHSGMRVKKGDIIGYMGSTGFSSGPHLHYEVLVGNQPCNPLRFVRRKQ